MENQVDRRQTLGPISPIGVARAPIYEMGSSLKAGDHESLHHFPGNIPPPIQGNDFTALLVQALFFQRVKQIAVKTCLKIQPVLLIQCGLERVRFKWLVWPHRNSFEHDHGLFAINPGLGRDQQNGMLAEKRTRPDFPSFQSASLGCALINCRIEAISSSLWE